MDNTYTIEKDSEGRVIYYSTANKDFWWEKKFDEWDNCIYYQDSTGFYIEKEFDESGNEIYFKNSYGVTRDFR